MARQRLTARGQPFFDGIRLPAGLIIMLLSLPSLIVVLVYIHETPGWLDLVILGIGVPGVLVGGYYALHGLKEYRLSRWSQY